MTQSFNFHLSLADTCGNAANTSYPDRTAIYSIEDLKNVAVRDHAAAAFYNGTDSRGRTVKAYRSNGTFDNADCIIMDCDNDHSETPTEWKTPADVKAAFPGVPFYVVYSRNHKKVKKCLRHFNSPCPLNLEGDLGLFVFVILL